MPSPGVAWRDRARGLSLIEVLVSLVIISIGLLGLIGMQARSISGQKDSFDRKAAAELLGQLTERMRANHLAFMNNDYASSLLPGAALPVAGACVAGAPCTPVQVAALDLMNWYQDLRARLPESGAVVAPTGPVGAAMGAGASSMRITVIWREANPNSGADARCTAVGVVDDSYRCLAAEVFP
ncbi:MAG: type IV pilus modification protein PilV [Lautropia sp.]